MSHPEAWHFPLISRHNDATSAEEEVEWRVMGVIRGGNMDDKPSCWQYSFHYRAGTNMLWPPANDGARVFVVATAFDNGWSSCVRQQMMEQLYLDWP